MKYSQEEKIKIYNAIDQIKAYIATIQPQIRENITIDFGPMEQYQYERERKYHLYIYDNDVSGRIGGLGIEFDKDLKLGSTRTTIYKELEYTVALMQNWANIKSQILDAIAEQNATIAVINNFEI